MGVSLYTSRIILATLGVEDFGIYGVVGGIVSMFSFLNSSMSGATSRFLMVALGKNDKIELQKTFSAALTIHIIIAIIILLLAETIGLWFLKNKLVIPDSRISTALWVYQISILTSMITITQVPYNATIIAHERMNIYAYVEILNVCLKLGVVYLLVIGNFDKLLFYASLLLCVSIVIAIIYRLYCLQNFAECKYKLEWDKKNIYPMLSFSGWDLYGNLSVVARTEGVNMLLNMFFGLLLNAANAVAIQVQNAVASFANNVITAIGPQIVKSYTTQNYQYTKTLLLNAAKYIYLLLLILSLPLILEMDFVLNIWLKNVPPHAVSFCRLTLLNNFFSTISIIVAYAIHANGNIKRLSLITGSLYLAVIPVSYIAFRFNGVPEISYICNVLFIFLGMFSNLYILRLYLPVFSIKEFISKVLLVCLIVSLVSFAISYGVKNSMSENFLRFCLVTTVSTVTTMGMAYIIAIDKQTKQYIKRIIINTIQKWKRRIDNKL
ncbi:MAG: polysaccharide biosynthesis protein [Candidatus Azobacteroides sp.]|nr:polysaccharide biosynthesis protein [Candidatus Azobacteroides sp.]